VYLRDGANSVLKFELVSGGIRGDQFVCGSVVNLRLFGSTTVRQFIIAENASIAYHTDTAIGVAIFIYWCSIAGSDCSTRLVEPTWGRPQNDAGIAIITDAAMCANVESKPAVRSPLRNVIKVVVSDSHACALLQSGAVYCWGMNDKCQLGIGRQGISSYSPRKIPWMADFMRLYSVYDGTTCAQRINGDVICWGLSAMPGEDCAISSTSRMGIKMAGVIDTAALYNNRSRFFVLPGALVFTYTPPDLKLPSIFITGIGVSATSFPGFNATVFAQNPAFEITNFNTTIIGPVFSDYVVYNAIAGYFIRYIWAGVADLLIVPLQLTRGFILASANIIIAKNPNCDPVYVFNLTQQLCTSVFPSATTYDNYTELSVARTGGGWCLRSTCFGTGIVFPGSITSAAISDYATCWVIAGYVYCVGSINRLIAQYIIPDALQAPIGIASSIAVFSSIVGSVRLLSITGQNITIVSNGGCNSPVQVVCADLQVGASLAGIGSTPINCSTFFGCLYIDWCVTAAPTFVPSPTITAITDAVDIVAGSFHTCVLRATGAVLCSGITDSCSYLLPRGGYDTLHFNYILGFPAIGSVSRIFAAGNTTCLLSQSRTSVVCMGSANSAYSWCHKETVYLYSAQTIIEGVFIDPYNGKICFATLNILNTTMRDIGCVWNNYDPVLGVGYTSNGIRSIVQLSNLFSYEVDILFAQQSMTIVPRLNRQQYLTGAQYVVCRMNATGVYFKFAQASYTMTPTSSGGSCGVDDSGMLACFGPSIAYKTPPKQGSVRVRGDGTIIKAVYGIAHTVLLSSTGVVSCIGDTMLGQCGNTLAPRNPYSFYLIGLYTPLINQSIKTAPFTSGLDSGKIPTRHYFGILLLISFVVVLAAVIAFSCVIIARRTEERRGL
jgi:hypothetical protein